jgi:hypothetical protein
MKTKSIILLFLVCYNLNYSFSQRATKRQSFTTNLEAYQGTWVYKSGTEIFRVCFKIGSIDSDESRIFGACLLGDYYYSKNNVVLDSYSASAIPLVYNDQSREQVIIYASNGKVESVNYARPNELYMEFYDKQKKKKVYSGEILLISPTKIRWILKDDEGDYDEEDWVESGFSVPSDIILTKE